MTELYLIELDGNSHLKFLVDEEIYNWIINQDSVIPQRVVEWFEEESGGALDAEEIKDNYGILDSDRRAYYAYEITESSLSFSYTLKLIGWLKDHPEVLIKNGYRGMVC